MKTIEFIGMPRAGKSTQIRLLARALRRRGKTVKIITDRKRAANICTPSDQFIAYKLVFFSKALEEYFTHENTCDYLLIDRGFNDAPVWFEVEKILKHIPVQRAEELKNTFVEFAKKTDLVICMTVDVQQSQERHRSTTHQKVDDVGMSKEYLTALQTAYRRIKPPTKTLIIDKESTKEQVHNIIINKIR